MLPRTPSDSQNREESREEGTRGNTSSVRDPTAEMAGSRAGQSTLANLQEETSPPPSNAPDTAMVSSAFMPNTEVLSLFPDAILLSSDNVQFYVHLPILTAGGAFHSSLLHSYDYSLDLPIIPLEDSSNVVNILLHAVYKKPCDQFSHTLSDIIAAIDRLPFYGIHPKDLITATHPLHHQILSLMPQQPLPVYALAGHHHIESIAVPCSAYLLSFPLQSISNEVAERIGAVYLKRLYHLHHQRQQTLANLLLRPFQPHHTISGCDFSKQQDVSRAWTLTAAYFVLESRPDASNQKLESTFGTIMPLISCDMCKQAVADKIKEIVAEWSICKNTI